MPGSDATDPPTDPVKRNALPSMAKVFPCGFFFWALSLFLLGMGMKLLMMRRCINALPYFDQWEAEGSVIYLPYLRHGLRFTRLFHAQNEHRIFFTHAYDFALLLLNHQWDSQLQMVLNAVIHCFTIAGFAGLMAGLMGRGYWLFIWLPLALAVMSPFGWENALWGFQSQFYFLLLFSLLTICLLNSRVLSWPWLCGAVTWVCALFTMASGLLAFVAVGAVVLLEIWKNPSGWRRHLPNLKLCVAFAFLGLLLVGRNANTQYAAAHSLKDFISSLGYNLSWPMNFRPWLAPLNLLPLVLLGWVYFRSSETNEPVVRIVLGVGAWAILQSVAAAIARGAGGRPPAWRYMDTLSFLFAANVLSAALLLCKYWKSARFSLPWCAAFAAWLVPCVVSLWMLNQRAWNGILPLWAHYQRTRVELTREFLATNEEKVFANRDIRDLPWIFVPDLVYMLRTKEIRSILPACARDPLRIIPKEGSSVFVPNGALLDKPDPPTEFCFGSYTTNGAAGRGTFESAPLTSSLPYLEVQVAGNLGRPNLSLELVELVSGKITRIKPIREPAAEWENVDVKAPVGEFKLVARDDSSTGWFAFKEPREMGRLSFWAQKVVGTGGYVLAAGCLSFAIALVSYFFPRKTTAKSTPSPFTA